MEKIRKLKSTCEAFGGLFRAVMWLVVGLMVLVALWAAILQFLPEEGFLAVEASDGSMQISYGDGFGLMIGLPREAVASPLLVKRNARASATVAAATLLFTSLPLLTAILYLLWQVTHSVERNNTPFLPENATRLRWLTTFLLAYQLLPVPFCSVLMGIFVSHRFTIAVEVQDFIGIFMACLPLVLAQVFDYGCALQQEVDETV